MLTGKASAELAQQAPSDSGPEQSEVHPFAGMWITNDGFVRLELKPDGRFQEDWGDLINARSGWYTWRGAEFVFVEDRGSIARGRYGGGEIATGPETFRKAWAHM
jgi:hypothetical protein